HYAFGVVLVADWTVDLVVSLKSGDWLILLSGVNRSTSMSGQL
ncbi:18383_t:CDS:1, partial [Racocetra persica]